jgi:hypothetical protein
MTLNVLIPTWNPARSSFADELAVGDLAGCFWGSIFTRSQDSRASRAADYAGKRLTSLG